MNTIKKLFFTAFCCLALEGTAQVGINTLTPLSTLDINGNLSVKSIFLIGSAAPTDINDGIYISINPQATDQVFRLPSPIDYPGRMYIIRNINNTNTAALTTSAGMLFFKGTTVGANTVYMYENNNRTLWVLSDGLNWTIFN